MAAGGAAPASRVCTQIKLCGSGAGVGLITIAALPAASQLAIEEKVPTWSGALPLASDKMSQYSIFISPMQRPMRNVADYLLELDACCRSHSNKDFIALYGRT
jgi:hypothetical protein